MAAVEGEKWAFEGQKALHSSIKNKTFMVDPRAMTQYIIRPLWILLFQIITHEKWPRLMRWCRIMVHNRFKMFMIYPVTSDELYKLRMNTKHHHLDNRRRRVLLYPPTVCIFVATGKLEVYLVGPNFGNLHPSSVFALLESSGLEWLPARKWCIYWND